MNRNWLKIILLFSIFGITLATGLYLTDQIYRTFIDVFKLSPSQVSSDFSKHQSECKQIKDCKLIEGDILIRRYITHRTWLIDKLSHPFFTHSAMYLGNDKIIEATGYEENPKDEIRISNFSQSDWQDEQIESWVIIRPRNISNKIVRIKKDLENIANDPDYRFGFPKKGYKRLSCSDLILNPLINEAIINVANRPEMITPDYLFWLAINNPGDFEIIAHKATYQTD